jgi:EmrB/QacA subfamily drug resistance transporter
VAICTGTFMLLIDITIVNVALPDLSRELGTSFAQLQWIVDVYALALASLVLGAGSLADLYGRRRLYLVGLAIFAAASLGCGLAPDAGWLIAARAVQGVGGAAMFATTIALVNTSYEGRDRGTAFGVWGAVVGAAAALGPVVGGALTEVSWRWIFIVNLPLCVFAVALTLAVVRESRRPGAPRPDLPGIALFTAGAGALVLGLVRAAADGWARPGAWVPVVGGVLLITGWVLVELRRPAPMLDVRLFRAPSFSGVMLGALLLNFAAFAALIYVTLWLQSVEGYSPLQSGLAFIPLMSLSFLVAAVGGRRMTSRPPRFVLSLGLLLVGVGSLLLVLVRDGGGWTVLIPGFVVLGLGVGICNPTVSAAALDAVPRERSGMASGAVNTARQLGFAVGIAVLGTVFTTRAGSVLDEAGTPEASEVASALSAGQAEQVLAAAGQDRAALADVLGSAFVDGLRGVVVAAGIAGLLGALLVVTLVRGAPAPRPAAAPSAGREPDAVPR